MLDALAKSIRSSIRTGGCARMQEPFLKSVYTMAKWEEPLEEKAEDHGSIFDAALDVFCRDYGFAVYREDQSPILIFTLP